MCAKACSGGRPCSKAANGLDMTPRLAGGVLGDEPRWAAAPDAGAPWAGAPPLALEIVPVAIDQRNHAHRKWLILAVR